MRWDFLDGVYFPHSLKKNRALQFIVRRRWLRTGRRPRELSELLTTSSELTADPFQGELLGPLAGAAKMSWQVCSDVPLLSRACRVLVLCRHLLWLGGAQSPWLRWFSTGEHWAPPLPTLQSPEHSEPRTDRPPVTTAFKERSQV